MKSQKRKAEDFRKLHHGDHVLVLPNAWDAASARMFEISGFQAVATSSAGVMVSLGYPDGEVIDRKDYAAAIGRISRVLSVPLSVDLVGGFGKSIRDLKQTVRLVLRTGAVGVNIEDFVHDAGRLIPVESQVERIRAVIETGTEMGVRIVVNARTDALRYAVGDSGAKFSEAVNRAEAYRDAGADCVYPMGLTDALSISKFVSALACPVNVMVRRELPPVHELERLGVARISFGPSASYAALALLKRAAAEILEKGTYDLLTENVITFEELNSLADPDRRQG